MQTEVWYNLPTRIFEPSPLTFKVLVPMNYFDDKSLNGHFGLELKMEGNKAIAILSSLEDNPGVGLREVLGLAATNVYENYISKQSIPFERILWMVNFPSEENEGFDLYSLAWSHIEMVKIREIELPVFYEPIVKRLHESEDGRKELAMQIALFMLELKA